MKSKPTPTVEPRLQLRWEQHHAAGIPCYWLIATPTECAELLKGTVPDSLQEQAAWMLVEIMADDPVLRASALSLLKERRDDACTVQVQTEATGQAEEAEEAEGVPAHEHR